MKKNLLIIGSNIFNAVGHEWVIDKLNTDLFNIHFILMNPKDCDLGKYLQTHHNCNYSQISYHSKKDLFKAVIYIYNYIKEYKIDVVHTHLVDGSMAGLTAAKFSGVKNRIHTRHHSDYHHKYFKHAVWYDKIINYLSTQILPVTTKVQEILIGKEHVKPSKITVVNHGFDIEDLTAITAKEVADLKEKYKIKENALVIGCISRYVEWKGLQYTIPAFKKYLEQYPNAVLILANAKGNYSRQVKALLKTIPEENYREIEFEENVKALYKVFDIFVHVPIDYYCEAYGQIYVEALALSIPSIFTLSGVANDFAIHKENCYLVLHKNINEIFTGLLTLTKEKDLKEKIINNGFKLVNDNYNINKMITQLESIYIK